MMYHVGIKIVPCKIVYYLIYVLSTLTYNVTKQNQTKRNQTHRNKTKPKKPKFNTKPNQQTKLTIRNKTKLNINYDYIKVKANSLK